MLRMLAAVVGSTLASFHAQPHAASAVSLTPVATGLDNPVYVTQRPGDVGGPLYVVEKTGYIRIVSGGAVTGTLLDIHTLVSNGDEQGLLSMAFDGAYAANRFFYVDFTDVDGDTLVYQLKANNGGTGLDSSFTPKLLLFVDQPQANHNGGLVLFAGQRYLLVGMGDGGGAGDPNNHGQELGTTWLSKLVRIDVRANPVTRTFVGYGLRNPWRFSLDRATGDLWLADVGQDAWEEIDYVPAAQLTTVHNFGWSIYEGFSQYKSGSPNPFGTLTFPVAVYGHNNGCAVIGGYRYRGAAIPSLAGRYVFGDLCGGWIVSVVPGQIGSTVRYEGSVSSLVSFGEDAAGELYAVSQGGTIYKLG